MGHSSTRLILVGLALLCGRGLTQTTEVVHARDLVLKADYTAAVESLVRPVAGGDRDALMLQGLLHAAGAGAAYDYPLALKYWRRAAFAGQKDAARLLVASLSNPYAREWWLDRIGSMSAPAIEAPKFLVLAERGGLVADREGAKKWIAQAAESGNPVGLYNAYHAAIFGARNSDAAKARVRRLLERAAERKLPEAMCELSSQLEQSFPMPAALSLNFPKDVERAAALMREAADLGDARAQLLWAHELNSRKAAVKNPTAAVGYYQKSSQQGNEYAAYFLSRAYSEGDGVERDAGRAAEYLRVAAQRGCDTAVTDYGQRLFRGRGMPADPAAAIAMMERSLACSSVPNADALALVAYAYVSGSGVEKDATRALWWAKWAAERGSPSGQKLVAQLTDPEGSPKAGLSVNK